MILIDYNKPMTPSSAIIPLSSSAIIPSSASTQAKLSSSAPAKLFDDLPDIDLSFSDLSDILNRGYNYYLKCREVINETVQTLLQTEYDNIINDTAITTYRQEAQELYKIAIEFMVLYSNNPNKTHFKCYEYENCKRYKYKNLLISINDDDQIYYIKRYTTPSDFTGLISYKIDNLLHTFKYRTKKCEVHEDMYTRNITYVSKHTHSNKQSRIYIAQTPKPHIIRYICDNIAIDMNKKYGKSINININHVNYKLLDCCGSPSCCKSTLRISRDKGNKLNQITEVCINKYGLTDSVSIVTINGEVTTYNMLN